MQVSTFVKNHKLNLEGVTSFLGENFGGLWVKSSKLTHEQIQSLTAVFLTPALPPQQEKKALPQAPQQTVQTKPQVQAQTEQPQPQQEEQPVNDAQIQTTGNNDVALTQSDLAAITTIRETFGEQGVQVFLQKKRQDLIVNKATTDALIQHDEQKLYQEVKLQVQNQLQIRDYIKEQQALDLAITQHSQLKAQRKVQTQKLNENLDAQLTDLLTKQQDFNATMELLGISMI